MKRLIVNYADGRYLRGQERLKREAERLGEKVLSWRSLPFGWQKHEDKPYAFKAYAMHCASQAADQIIWCDASIVPIRSLEPIWERIARDGYWFSHNGFDNYTWTADSAYKDLFWCEMEYARKINRKIPHVVATAFGLDTRHDLGRKFLERYFWLASETKAFCGPWFNLAYTGPVLAWRHAREPNGTRTNTVCGPPDVAGHRHDQTAASVLAWKLGFKLTNPPEIFSYPPGDERTILLADGDFR